MGHPVTTNPLIIMMINMTVVFIVLIALSYLIKLIHLIDPTAKKEEVKEEPAPVVQSTPETPPAPVIDSSIPEETIAVIFAAIAGYGYATGHVHAIRPVYHKIWEHSGRYQEGR